MPDPRPSDLPAEIARGMGDTPPDEARGRLWPWALLAAAVVALAIAFLAYLPG